MTAAFATLSQAALVQAGARAHAHRHDGWTPPRQRAFLERIAEGHTADAACRHVGLSVTSLYALRRRASGAAFAIGWDAARLLARDRITDLLTARAIDGQEETITRADGSTVTRHRYDNRLAAYVLTRLDRYADTHDATAAGQGPRVVAGDFDAFLTLIDEGGDPARAGLFVGTRVVEAPQPEMVPVLTLASADRYLRVQAGLDPGVRTDDLDIARMADWDTEQWARAEASGLLRRPPSASATATSTGHNAESHEHQHPPLRESGDGDTGLVPWDDTGLVWWDDTAGDWRTRFPPPAGFAGTEHGTYGAPDYARDLTPDERAAVDAPRLAAIANARTLGAFARDRWFARAAAGATPATPARPTRTARRLARKRQQKQGGAAPGRRPGALSRHLHHERTIPMADHDHDISTLNGLIETTLDSVDGYTEAAKDAENARFVGLFNDRAAERRQVATTLQQEVRSLGGTPDDDGTVLAGAHRIFLNLKAAVTGRDDKAIVNEVERGEDHIKAKFEKALADTDLTPATRQAIQDAYTSVKQGHDQMRDIKHSMEA
ncbi:PA2169 family four-helix-bundle protein [Sphingomonas sp. Leaf17]|uniref:PA2169 family four-helix-bundle protein n=1 Tax=Sphingomonas sp. Leaf17 TaxID=1735683 RepID=UPI000AAA36A7|nr:PA2169 family four-helix-bundle protein [Sphingomonas sp. Leaf17]